MTSSTTDPTTKQFPQTFLGAPPGACEIVLVRHGQSQPYVSGQPFPLIDGHGDPVLSPRGEWQAERVGERLRDHPISAIYASSLTRTQQTAAPLAAARGLDIAIDPDLREVFMGDWEGGLFREKAAEDHPAVAALRTTGEWSEIPGAETNAELTSRTVAAVQRIALSHPNEMVGVFCHGGVVAALMHFATNTPPLTFRGVRNASLTHLYVSDDEWLVRTFNDATHVGPLNADLDGHLE